MLKYIIYWFKLEIPEGSAPMVEYGFHVGMISIVVLLSFTSVIGYLIAFYLLDYYKIDNKYPKF